MSLVEFLRQYWMTNDPRQPQHHPHVHVPLHEAEGPHNIPHNDAFDEDDEVENIGLFNTCIGDNTISYRLLRAETFQQLLEAGEDSGVYHSSQLLIPTAFSPAQ